MGKTLDIIREFLWSMWGEIPLDFDKSAEDAIQQIKPEENGHEILGTLGWLIIAALGVLVLALVLIRR